MYKLTPAIHPIVGSFLHDQKLVRDVVRAHGSPLNVVFPDVVAENVQGFENAMKEAHVAGKVYVAHKPNKSKALVQKLAATNARIDVASLGELRSALSAGFQGSRIEATGIKNKHFLTLAILHDVLISVDSFDELGDIASIASSLGKVGRILVRLSGFASLHTHIVSKDTRFGIPVADLENVFDSLRRHANVISFAGFAFHLESNSDAERLIAVESTLHATLEAVKQGFAPTVINIGGGFPVSLLEKPEEWDAYISALKQSVVGKHASLTWNKSGLGFRNDNGTLSGAPQFREHVVSPAGHSHFVRFLSAPLPSFEGRSLVSVLSDLMLELYIEPGKAVFDQAGITLAEVIALKQSIHGENVVIADLNKTNLNAAEIEHMVDPVVITDKQGSSGEGYIAGNLCSGSDMIYKHKTFFDLMPSKGDILAFPNTAAYLMDFNESEILQQPIAEKIAYWKDGSDFVWAHDDHYAL